MDIETEKAKVINEFTPLIDKAEGMEKNALKSQMNKLISRIEAGEDVSKDGGNYIECIGCGS